MSKMEKVPRVIIVSAIPYIEHAFKLLNLDNIEVAAVILIDTPYTGIHYINNGQKQYPAYAYEWVEQCIEEKHYDYILLCYPDDMIWQDMRKHGLMEKDKLLDMRLLYNLPALTEFGVLFSAVKSSALSPGGGQWKAFATGMSYAYNGIEFGELRDKTLNLTSYSQDLYYDYKFASMTLSLEDYKFEHAIIGLSPYSFHYDLSKSLRNNNVMFRYMLATEDVHNFPVSWDIIKKIINIASIKEIESDTWKRYGGNYDFANRIGSKVKITGMSNKERLLTRDDARSWDRRFFPETSKENIEILEAYLRLCKDKRVKPYVVVFPVTDIFRKIFSPKMLDEFYCIIRYLEKHYDFSFYDFWASDKFSMGDFYNLDHLNYNGARKMTALLNEVIE